MNEAKFIDSCVCLSAIEHELSMTRRMSALGLLSCLKTSVLRPLLSPLPRRVTTYETCWLSCVTLSTKAPVSAPKSIGWYLSVNVAGVALPGTRVPPIMKLGLPASRNSGHGLAPGHSGPPPGWPAADCIDQL